MGRPAKNHVTFACETCGRVIALPVERCGHVATCPYCESYVDVPDSAEDAIHGDSETTAPHPMSGSAGDEQPGSVGCGPRTTVELWIEVLAVLCLAYLPAAFSAVSASFEHNRVVPSFASREIWLIVTALEVSAPVLVIMALGRDPWAVFGIVRPKWLLDALLGCAIWAVAIVTSISAKCLLPLWMLEGPASPYIVPRPEGIPAHFLLLAGCVAVAFEEELVMRAYLIPRLERLLRSTWLAVLITTAMFASYHIYQGVTGVVGAAAMGLVYAVFFCLYRRLWPLCVAHALHNFLVFL